MEEFDEVLMEKIKGRKKQGATTPQEEVL